MSSIKQDLIKGVFWSAVEKYSSLALNIVISMILARILSPHEYGIVSIATVLIAFLTMFATMGIGPAIIQRKDLDQNDLDNIFTFSLVIGAFLAIFLYFLSDLIAEYYGEDALINICRILSISLFFSAANMVPNALMAKNQLFKEIARRTLLLLLISGPISIVMAFCSLGVYSLLVAPIITSVGIFVFNYHYYPCKICWKLSLKPIKSIFGYSIYQFLFEVINYFSRNLDKLIVGKYISVSALGFYDKSYRLMLLPLNNITSVIGPVVQPVLSKMQDNKVEIARKYSKLILFVAVLSFPLGVYLYCTAYELIYLFYGNQWNAAIPCFKILALSIPLQVILCTSGSVFQAANATKPLFYVGLINTFVTVSGFLISCFYFATLEAIALSWTITTSINFVSSYITLYGLVLKTSPFVVLKALINPVFCSLILMLAYLFIPDIDNWVYSLLVKTILAIFVTVVFVQLSGIYDFYDKIHHLITKNK